jgi:hypothetical protein
MGLRDTFPHVENKTEVRLTGPVNHGALAIVNCFAQNPSAEMRGGFLRWNIDGDITADMLLKMPMDEVEAWCSRNPARAKRLMGG